MMRIECYLSESCGSGEALRANIQEALRLEGRRAEVSLRRVGGAVARALGLRGSPTVLIDGRDIAPAEMEGFG